MARWLAAEPKQYTTMARPGETPAEAYCELARSVSLTFLHLRGPSQSYFLLLCSFVPPPLSTATRAPFCLSRTALAPALSTTATLLLVEVDAPARSALMPPRPPSHFLLLGPFDRCVYPISDAAHAQQRDRRAPKQSSSSPLYRPI